MSKLKLRKDFIAMIQFIRDTQNTEDETIVPINGEDIDTALLTSLSNMNNFDLIMNGPKNSPYDGGKFVMNINIPEDYPFKSPNIVFKTRIYHPHISKNGLICIETLGAGWGPNVGLLQSLMSIYALLFSPNNHNPKAEKITENDIKKHEKYCEKVSEKTHKYAK